MFGFPSNIKLKLAHMNNPTEAAEVAGIEPGGKTLIGEAEYRVIQRIDAVMGILTFLERCDQKEEFITMLYYSTPGVVSITADISRYTEERARDIFLHLQGILDRHTLPLLDLDYSDVLIQGLNQFQIVNRKIEGDEATIELAITPVVDKFTIKIRKEDEKQEQMQTQDVQQTSPGTT